ncbi:MAG: hypothetical protein WB791_11160 [Waddliaceae bacterium]
MSAKKHHETSGMSILDAVEALSTISDLEFEREVDLASKEEIAKQNQMVTAQTVQWIDREDPDSTVQLIRETFHSILLYLRNYYSHEKRSMADSETVEGVKTIMVLVGEAAKKLDTYTTLFQHTKSKSCKNSKEYKQLQEFYLTRVARKIDEGILGKWILELTKGAMDAKKEAGRWKAKKPMQIQHVFIDLESVKKDTEYELFFLRKENGTRFFNPRLIRNIKLVCDFGETIKGEKEPNTLSRIKVWYDCTVQEAARNILQAQQPLLDRYFHETKGSPKRELISLLNKTIISLMLSSNPKNLLRHSPTKSCSEYFIDFQFFLRRALKSREYHRLLAYPPKKSSQLGNYLLDVIHNLCRAFFTSIQGYQILFPLFEKMIQEAEEAQSPEHAQAAEKSRMVWSRLAADYAAMQKLIRKHPNGPLIKDLEIFQYGTYHAFDPITQFNIPNQLYSFYVKEHKMTNIRLPTPTYQEFIDRAEVIEEFKAFLRDYAKSQFIRRHLIINFQDRTSWREHFRATALEQLQEQRDIGRSLVVVTLAKDTEFYHQSPPYRNENNVNLFIENFKEHLADENCGYYFPKEIRDKLFPLFIDGVIDATHRIFFSGKNVLPKNCRLDFIEIFYLFLELKIIELTQPDTFSLLCKDSIDIGGVATTQLYAFLKILTNEKMSESEYEHLNLILYTAPLLVRERIVLPDRFHSMVNALKRIEGIKQEFGEENFQKIIQEAFGTFFESSILKSPLVIPTF